MITRDLETVLLVYEYRWACQTPQLVSPWIKVSAKHNKSSDTLHLLAYSVGLFVLCHTLAKTAPVDMGPSIGIYSSWTACHNILLTLEYDVPVVIFVALFCFLKQEKTL